MSQTDDQSLRVLTGKQIADKAIHSLKGILLGINLDGEIHHKEISELEEWALSHKQLINRNPFREFILTIEEAVTNKVPSKEAIEDLYWLTQKYEGDSYYYSSVTSDLQILQGVCHGILSDGSIHEKEIKELNKWIEQHEHLNTHYPYDEIRSLLLNVLSDGVVDEEEKKMLKAYFSQFIKLHSTATHKQILDDTVDVKISGLCTSEPNVTFTGKTFCVTGTLKRSNRETLHNDIKKLGGVPVDTVTKKTNYLIVGDNGNPAWAFSCYGRKVEKAISLRKEGYNIMIIHEFSFGDILDEAK